MKEFLLGVLASIIAALILYFLRYQISGLIHLLFSKVYPNISGQWTVEQYLEYDDINDHESQTVLVPAHEEEEHIFIKAKIKQFANRITGTIEYIKDGNIEEIEEIKGKVTASRIVLLNSETKTEGHHNFGNLLLKMSSDTRKLTGYSTFLCAECQDTGYHYIKMTKD